eukprot:3940897-Rhodomonas_salina.6
MLQGAGVTRTGRREGKRKRWWRKPTSGSAGAEGGNEKRVRPDRADAGQRTAEGEAQVRTAAVAVPEQQAAREQKSAFC